MSSSWLLNLWFPGEHASGGAWLTFGEGGRRRLPIWFKEEEGTLGFWLVRMLGHKADWAECLLRKSKGKRNGCLALWAEFRKEWKYSFEFSRS
jgi:hypothetical protein